MPDFSTTAFSRYVEWGDQGVGVCSSVGVCVCRCAYAYHNMRCEEGGVEHSVAAVCEWHWNVYFTHLLPIW